MTLGTDMSEEVGGVAERWLFRADAAVKQSQIHGGACGYGSICELRQQQTKPKVMTAEKVEKLKYKRDIVQTVFLLQHTRKRRGETVQ
jgi:hypothetical protein